MKSKLFVLMALLLTGCGPSSEEYASPEVELNQSPKSTYRLDFRFQDAPGPFTKISSRAFYQVTEPGCVKPLWGSGAVVTPDHSVLLSVKRVANGHYQAVFHADALRDENYFGFGMCKWSFQNIGLRFSSPTSNFSASFSNTPRNLGNIEPAELIFLDRDYFKKPEVGDMVFGEKKDLYLPKLGSRFSVTMSAEKLEP